MDPKGHHITLHEHPGRVEVSLGGTVLASSDRVTVLEETGLPPRHYFPRDDVHMSLLEATRTETVCPFKGQASYWSATVDGEEHHDLAWAYERPIDGMEGITGLVCFYEERVDTTVDGELVARPVSPWSQGQGVGTGA
jgi:uncharacterized protein (DUF427 family)